MKAKQALREMIIKASAKKSVNKKKLVMSYVSLFLTLTIIITATVSWFFFSNTSSVDSDTFTLESASGLRVNEGEAISNHIVLKDINLDEASSVDGRNMFFPTVGSFTSSTDSMFFREGNVGDKNVKYVYKDFTLKGDSVTTYTYVYVKSYSITVGDETFNGSTDIQYDENNKPISQTKHAECPIRIAFITNSSKTPQVIDSTAIVDNYVNKYNAVNSADDAGYPSTVVSSAVSFSDYYFVTGQPIFTLKNNEPLDVTMVVWLEGTENTKTGTSNSEVYAGKDISIDIELESNWDDMDTVTFVDETLGDSVDSPSGASPMHWINSADENGNDTCIVIMSYTDNENITRTVVMEHTEDYKWIAPIPNDVYTNISFYRYSLTDEIIYNAWHTKVGVNDELNPDITVNGSVYSNWIGYSGYGPLQESRIVNGKRSLVYTAVRGNNYNKVSETDPDLEKKRLSPCLGYWDFGNHLTPSDPTVQPTTQQGATQATVVTTAPSDTDKNIQLGVAAAGLKSWVQQLLSGDYKLYVVFQDGSMAELSGSGDRYENSSVMVSSGTYIKGFSIISSYDRQDLALTNGLVPITSNVFMTFTMQEDDTMKRTS